MRFVRVYLAVGLFALCSAGILAGATALALATGAANAPATAMVKSFFCIWMSLPASWNNPGCLRPPPINPSREKLL